MHPPLKRLECVLKKRHDGLNLMDIRGEFDRDLTSAIVNMYINYKLVKGKKGPSKFLDITLNFCDALLQLNTIPMVNVFVRELLKTSNLPYTCPLKGNILYNVTDYELTEAAFPVYTPAIHFNFSIDYYHNHKIFASSILQGSTYTKR
ncbi:uncharacterized protein LOC142219458 [Haematobia irritans]|uniref:uncharacterized protein LOC142219458 n=1 Tax=Haematobia irritans TaxID=7368 RepID=UPI003F508389